MRLSGYVVMNDLGIFFRIQGKDLLLKSDQTSLQGSGMSNTDFTINLLVEFILSLDWSRFKTSAL